MIDILIPVLRRPHNAQRVVDSIEDLHGHPSPRPFHLLAPGQPPDRRLPENGRCGARMRLESGRRGLRAEDQLGISGHGRRMGLPGRG